MTKYTLDDIREAQHTAFHSLGAKYAHPEDTDEYRLAFANALGLTVEDPKPEPGIYLHNPDGPTLVDSDGISHWLGNDGHIRSGRVDPKSWHEFATPARVVPAEPVELPGSEDVYAAIRQAMEDNGTIRGASSAATTAVMNLLGGTP